MGHLCVILLVNLEFKRNLTSIFWTPLYGGRDGVFFEISFCDPVLIA
jgi:hypothetical protein